MPAPPSQGDRPPENPSTGEPAAKMEGVAGALPEELSTVSVVCTVPTYNESENILDLSRALLNLGSNVQVLVVDDDSPDGTWRLVAEAGKDEPRLQLLHRTQDRGRGAAGRDGFVRALEMGADYVIEMDADFSHHPRYIPEMLARLAAGRGNRDVGLSGARPLGLVLGSRAVAGGADADRGLVRRWVTKTANAYIRVLLGLRVGDCNSGFRAWPAETLRKIRVEDTFSPGPAIVQELLYKTARAGYGIEEVPIQFVDRERGDSTLTWKILLQGYTAVLKLRLLSWMGKL